MNNQKVHLKQKAMVSHKDIKRTYLLIIYESTEIFKHYNHTKQANWLTPMNNAKKHL